MRPTVRARIGIAVLSVACSLLVAEGLARLLLGAPPGSAAIYQASDIPGARYTMIPSLDTHALGAGLRTNALGFRGPDWSTDAADGGLRIALIGDSHALGFGVPFEESVGEVLAQLLRARLARPVEVMNFGVSGYNARQQLAVLRAVALGFAPDVVVLMPCNNDDEPELFVAASGHLVAQAGAEVVAPLVRPLAGRSALVTAASRAAKRLAARAAAAPVPAVPAPRGAEVSHEAAVPAALDAAVGAPLRAMIDSSRRAGATVVLASFAGPLEWRRLFQQTARDEQVPLVELLELFPEARDWDELVRRFGLGWDPHLGPEAHRRWAHALAALFPDGPRPPRVPSDAPSDAPR
jgi:lysophospholipase L1-like esterase